MQGIQFWSLVQKDPMCQGATTLCAATTKPIFLELVLHNKRSHHMQLESKPPLTATRESAHVAAKTQYSKRLIN